MKPESNEKPKPREVEIVHASYQPSRAELREDLRVNATFKELAKAVVQPVKVRWINDSGVGSPRASLVYHLLPFWRLH